jgi:hypothetical protein
MLCELLIAAAIAGSGPFPQKTMLGDWPERQVERGTVLPKGHVQFALAIDSKTTDQYRDDWGGLVDYDSAKWHFSRLWLEIDQGFSRRTTLYLRIPWVMARLENDLGTNIRTRSLGDIHVGLRMEPAIERFGKKQHLGFRLDLKVPSGVEWPDSLLGGPSHTGSLLTGTGITNLGFHLSLRKTFWRWAMLDLTGGYTFKFPGIVGYVVDSVNYANGWLDPGDEARVDIDAGVQIADDWAVIGGPVVSHRGRYRMGISGPSPFRTQLDPLPSGEGTWFDVDAALSFEPHDRIEIQATWAHNLAGGDTRTFAALGLEEFSPQPGMTLGGRVATRW